MPGPQANLFILEMAKGEMNNLSVPNELALFPSLPRFCYSVCIKYNTRKRKSGGKAW